jgi:hypothetical protein
MTPWRSWRNWQKQVDKRDVLTVVDWVTVFLIVLNWTLKIGNSSGRRRTTLVLVASEAKFNVIS